MNQGKTIQIYMPDDSPTSVKIASPSAAAGAVLARRANGWTEWKDESGNTLDLLKRQE